MKKLLLFAVALFMLNAMQVAACTTFFLSKNGQMVFGRNYDWLTDAGMLANNQRGLFKTSEKNNDGNTISWISKYASMSFIQYGKEFATGGMNEKGLVVELMWLDGTKYPNPDQRPALGVLQWIQYQLDNSATVSELVATDKLIRIASKGNTPLHYLVADASGDVATIEFLEGKMLVHRGNDLPFAVLTNNKYAESLQKTAPAASGSKTSFADNSIDRFAKACDMVKRFRENDIQKPVVDYSFEILNKVAQGSFTKWSIVYDISNKKIYFKTNRYPQVKIASFAAFDFLCTSPAKAYDLNQEGAGEISGSFEVFSQALNQRIVEKAFLESNSQINATAAEIRSCWEYAFKTTCAPVKTQ